MLTIFLFQCACTGGFGGFGKSEAGKPLSSSLFPAKPAETSSSTSVAGFPPMSTKAPTPFGNSKSAPYEKVSSTTGGGKVLHCSYNTPLCILVEIILLFL